jgi:hypothetical protein
MVTQTVFRLTLIYGLLHESPFWYISLPFRVVAILGLLFDSLLRREAFWFTIFIFALSNVVANYWTIGSSQFVYLYWCLGLFLLVAFERLTDLRKLGRLLIGFTFAFSLLWKVISPDFSSGNFFTFVMLTDKQFTPLTTLLTGLTPTDISSNSVQMPQQFTGPVPTEVIFTTSDTLPMIGRVLAWSTILVEGLVAIGFITASRFRDAALMVFMVTSYPVTPVEIFSSLLAVLGFAQADSQLFRFFYLAIFLISQLLFFRVDLLSGSL